MSSLARRVLVGVLTLAVGLAPAGPSISAAASPNPRRAPSAAIQWPDGTDLIQFENIEGIALVLATASMPVGFDTSGVWVLDTGAGYLVLDTDLAIRGGLAHPQEGTPGVGLTDHPMPRFRVGTLARDQVTPILMVQAGMVRDITDRPVLGLIGQQILRDRIVWVDYVHGRLAFVPSPSRAKDSQDAAARIARSRTALGGALARTARPVPFDLAGDGKVLVSVTVPDGSPGHRSRPLTMIVDTGASKSVLFERTLGRAVPGHSRWRSLSGLTAPTLVGAAPARVARVPALVIETPGRDGRSREAARVDDSDVVLMDTPLQRQLEQVTGSEIHGLLGYSFLRHFQVGFDYPNSVLWLDPVRVARDERTHEYSHVGIQMERRNRLVEVVAVATGSPAERAGVRVGDEVLTVAGVPIVPGALIDAARRLEGAPGSSVELTLRRDGRTRTLRVRRARLL